MNEQDQSWSSASIHSVGVDPDNVRSARDDLQGGLPRQIRQQLFCSCLLAARSNDNEYIYVGEAFRRVGAAFFFWRRKRALSTRDKLICGLLK